MKPVLALALAKSRQNGETHATGRNKTWIYWVPSNIPWNALLYIALLSKVTDRQDGDTACSRRELSLVCHHNERGFLQPSGYLKHVIDI